MKSEIQFLKVLYWVFCIILGVLIVTLVISTAANLNPKPYDPYANNVRVIPSEYGGIPIPVNLTVNFPDTIIEVKGTKNGITETRTSTFSGATSLTRPMKVPNADSLLYSAFDSIVRIDTSTYSFVDNMGPFTEKDPFVVSNDIHIKGEVSVLPNHLMDKILLYLRFHLKIVFMILIFYQLIGTVKNVEKTLGFNLNLGKKVKLIGLILIAYTALNLVLEYIISNSWSRGMDFIKYSQGNAESMPMHIAPTINFEFDYLIVGVLLIILSSLIKRSAIIENEWSSIV